MERSSGPAAVSSFGDKLRRERETRGTALEEIVQATQIQGSYLEALENNAFDELPGPAFGKFYIRAYAEVLGFDPEPLIADYDRERHRRLHRDRSAQTRKRPARPAPGPRRRAWLTESGEVRRDAPPEPERDAEVGASAEPEAPASVEAPAAIAESAPVEPPAAVETPVPVVEPREQPSPVLRRPVAAETAAIAAPTPIRDARRTATVTLLWTVALLAVGLPLLLIGFSLALFRGEPAVGDRAVVVDSGTAPVETAPVAEPAAPPQRTVPASGSPVTEEKPVTAAAKQTEAASPPPAETPARSAETPAAPGPESVSARAAVGASLRVAEFGVGRRVVDRRLEGRTDRFREGEVAWFSTRVVGGRPGDHLRHVWLRDGRRVQTIRLRLGGHHWRTHSNKTLWGTGRWTVEARDSTGKVLARAAFDCVPAGS